MDKLPLLPTRLQLLRLIYLRAEGVHGFLFMLLEISNSPPCVSAPWAASVIKVLGPAAHISKSLLVLTLISVPEMLTPSLEHLF